MVEKMKKLVDMGYDIAFGFTGLYFCEIKPYSTVCPLHKHIAYGRTICSALDAVFLISMGGGDVDVGSCSKLRKRLQHEIHS